MKIKLYIFIHLLLTFPPKVDPDLYRGNFELLPHIIRFSIAIKNIISGRIIAMLLLFYMIFICGINSFSQQYHFKTYSVEDGLAQSSVSDILQDRDGYMWFATSGGLSRFNGLSFRNITTLEGLISNRTSAIIEDKRGLIWAATNEGISIINPKSLFKTNTLAIINITTENGLIGNGVRAILEDSKGLIWLGTNKGISILAPEKNEWKQLKQLAKSTPVHLFLGKSVSPNGVNLPADPVIKFENLSIEDGLVNDTINDIFEDSKGNLWFSTNGGISKLTIKYGKQNAYYTFQNFTTDDGLSHNFVNTIFEDNKGIFWIDMLRGLLKVNFSNDYSIIKIIENVSDTLKVYFQTSYGIVHSILQDNKNNLWFSHFLYNPERQAGENIERVAYSVGLQGGAIMSSLQDREGNIWFGTAGHGVSKYMGKTFENYTEKHGLIRNNVRAIIEDKNGNIWIGMLGGVSKFHPIHTDKKLLMRGQGFKNFTGGSIWSMLEDKHGNIWFGAGRRLVKYIPPPSEGEKGKFEYFTNPSGQNAFMSLYEDSKGNLWTGSFGGLSKLVSDDSEGNLEFRYYTTDEGIIHNRVNAIHEDSRGNLWVGTSGGISVCNLLENDSLICRNFTTEDGIGNNTVLSIAEDSKGNIWFGTMVGISKFIYYDYNFPLPLNIGTKGTFKNFTAKHGLSSDTPYLLIFDDDGYLYVGTNKGVDKFDVRGSTIKKIKHFGKLEGFYGIETNHNAVCKDHYGNLWFGTMKGAIKYNPKLDKPNLVEPLTHINKIQLFFEDFDWSAFSDTTNIYTGLPERLVLPYEQNHLTFDFIALSLTIPEKVKYQWKLEGFDKDWSPVAQKTEATYSNLPPGEYSFMVKSCNNDGLWNKTPTVFSFIITPPFWQTWWFYTLCFMAVVSCVFVFVKVRERNLKRERGILEKKVKQRTVVIEKQKEELAVKNKDITASIRYAETIQHAILPSIEDIRKALPESFVLFKPKDIVSGDFYFYAKVRDSIIIAACDSTGHGVPGAFMSMIGSQLLNEIVNDKLITNAAQVLNQLRDGIIHAFGEAGATGEQKDGMDMALCVLQYKKDNSVVNLQYAGAYNPLYIIRNGKNSQDSENFEGLEEIKPDKQPIGFHMGKKHPFTNHKIDLQKGDTVYIFSDGYQDQFGGPRGKKFMSKRLKQLFLDVQEKGMEEQKEHLNKTIEEWKGREEQVDDILVIGVRV